MFDLLKQSKEPNTYYQTVDTVVAGTTVPVEFNKKDHITEVDIPIILVLIPSKRAPTVINSNGIIAKSHIYNLQFILEPWESYRTDICESIGEGLIKNSSITNVRFANMTGQFDDLPQNPGRIPYSGSNRRQSLFTGIDTELEKMLGLALTKPLPYSTKTFSKNNRSRLIRKIMEITAEVKQRKCAE